MKVEGLGDERRGAISQICHLVGEVKEFGIEQFRRMVNDYEKDDITMHGILNEAITQADDNYTHFLDAKMFGTAARYWALTRLEEGKEGTVLSKVTSELRERLRDEKEYRREFLGPEIKRVAMAHDARLRKIQKEEIRRQREELKARAKIERKSRSYGIGF